MENKKKINLHDLFLNLLSGKTEVKSGNLETIDL